MMEVLDLMKKRRSIRFYTHKPISRANVEKLVESARWAPNGHRIYSQRLLIVQKRRLIARIRTACPGLHGNPTAVIVIACDKERESEIARNYLPIGAEEEKFFRGRSRGFFRRRVEHLSTMNCAIAAENICLVATAIGVGSCMIYGFDLELLKRVLGLPETIVPQLLISLGYPDKRAEVKFSRSIPQSPYRRSVKDTVIGWVK